jgi:hypothetical protein
VGSTTYDWSYPTRGRVGDVGVSEAHNDVEVNFNSGAKVEELSGVGSERVFEKPKPRPAGWLAEAPSVASPSLFIENDGLGVRRGEPCIMGTGEIRTLFFRRWPWRALGLPFNAEGLPLGESGVESHWKGLPPLLLEDVCECWRFGDLIAPARLRELAEVGHCRSGEPAAEKRSWI